MSAFVVSQNHIATLADYAVRKGIWLGSGSARIEDYRWIYQALASQNVRSVCSRYPDDESEYTAFIEGRSARSLAITDPVQIIKACDCLDYQSSETEDWKETPAHRILQEIRRDAINSLPGYDDAKWAIA